MKRKIYQKLVQWKEQSSGKTAMLIDGARRVGKSYIAEEFAKNNYKSYILIDFTKARPEVLELFTNFMEELDSFFLYISNYYNVKLYPRETLFIFDEVQMFPKARGAIKHLVADGRYDYLETGSLMSIRKNVKDIVIPSEEEHLELLPMDFEEFLWAMGNELLMPFIQDCFQKMTPLGQVLHRKAMEYLREYMIVGGMPQVVEAYRMTKDFQPVDKIKRNILQLYRQDIYKHSLGNELDIEAIFDAIPARLSQHDKKFKIGDLKKGARMRQYQQPLFWLIDAMLINPCFNSTEPNLGLRLNLERKRVKYYFLDTGLLISHAFDERGLASEEIYKKLLFNKLAVNQGMLLENLVAQMLVAAGHKLYFYTNTADKKAESRMEIDFLIAKSKITNKHNISPIEVKSGTRYALTSLNKFRTKYVEQVNIPYVLHTNDVKVDAGIVYLPIYMTMLL